MNYIDLFEKAAERFSDRTALVDAEGAHSVTYAELNRLSSLVAGKLRSLGFGKGDFILVCMERCLEYYVAYLGILKAGCVVVPTIPEYPQARIDYIRENCGARLIVTKDFLCDIRDCTPVSDPADDREPALLAFTSGSTGKPKGIQHSAADMARAAIRGKVFFTGMSEIVTAATATFSFIVHYAEYNTPLLLGASIHILPDTIRKSAQALEDYINRFSITFAFIPPQMMRLIHTEKVPSLKQVLIGGERASGIHSDSVRIYNGFGMTETSHCIAFPVDRAYANTPLGTPINGIEVQIRDENGRLLPDGKEGEMWICGDFDTVYFRDPERTAKTMLRLEDGRTAVKTGDICCRDEKGRIVYISRKDWMVKINGQRVETLEIENLMMEMPEIRTAAVKAFENEDGQTYLTVFYDVSAPVSEDTIRARLRENLTEYMIPRFFVELPEMPKNLNGKLDRKALLPPDIGRYKSTYAAPETETQRMICEAFSAVLHCGRVGIDDDFFALGGDSIRVLQLAEVGDARLTPARVLAGLTPRGIAALCAEAAEEQLPHLDLIPEVTPLTDSQRGVYLDCVESPESVMYNIPMLCRLPAETDLSRFLSAARQVIATHPALRVTVELRDGVPSMILHDEQIPVEEKTVASLADECAAFVRPFDLEKGPLCRFELCRSDEGLAFLFDVHHIIFDGTSAEALVSRIAQVYGGEAAEPEKLTLFDLAHAEAENGHEAAEQAKAFFDTVLSGIDPDSRPIPDVIEEVAPSGAGRFSTGTERKFSRGEILRFVRSRGISENTLFLGAFAYALSCFIGLPSSCFCTAYHGRKEPALSQSVGMFVRTLPLAFRFDEEMRVADFLPSVQDQLSGAISNGQASFADLASAYGVSTDVVFIYQADMIAGAPIEDGVMRLEPLETRDIQTKLDFMLFTRESGYELLVHYDRSLYSEELVRGLVNLYLNTVAGMLRSEKLSGIRLTDAEELERLDAFNRTEAPYESEKTVVDLFRMQGRRKPDNLCVVSGKTRYTYRETDELTDRLAGHLLRLGFGPGKVAGVLIPRDENMVICSLGILKAGGAYLPLDPSYPPERLNRMMKDSGADLLIAAPEYSSVITEDFPGLRLSTKELDAIPETGVPLPAPRPNDLFVVLYTSGSTGVPKGVLFEHSNAMVTAEWVKKYFGICESSRVTSYASYGFDAHAFDIYPALIAGAELHIIPEDLRLDLRALRAYYNENGITHTVMSTQVGRQFALMGGHKTLRHLSVAGEKLTPLNPTEGFTLYNLYGPTEGSVVTSAFRVDRKYRDIPIGRPVDNLKAYIVGSSGRLLPPGAVGELWIAGPHVTRGYHNRPEKTAEAYGENPFPHSSGYGRVYRTGDIVRFLPDGNLQFIGRRDGQVKVRGFRVELTEVEEIIRRFDGIEDAAVAAFDDPAGGKYIAAYVVSGSPVDTEALNNFILSEKPPYMVPAVTMQIDAIPLNQNQKVNRRALPKPERPLEDIVFPENETQQTIFDVCAEILGNSRFGIDTDLYRAGLTSIGVIRLSVGLEKAFGIPFKVADLRTHSTVKQLEALISSSEKAAKYEILADYPITQTQMGIYVECAARADSVTYNMPMLIRLSKQVDTEKLVSAVTAALNAHPYTKATLFADAEGNIRAHRNDAQEPPVERVRCDVLPPREDLVRPFPLLGGPLCRVTLYETGDGNYLFMDFHHIISDGTSENILLSDISRAYAGLEVEKENYTGFEAALDEEAARASKRYTDARAYYDSIFKGCEANCLPPKAPERDLTGVGSAVRTAEVSAAAVQNRCEKEKVTPNAFFNAAFGYTLSRFGQFEDVVYTTVYNGRSDSRLASCVTMLVKTLPVLVHTDGNRNVSDMIRDTQIQLMDSMANDIFSFAEISASCGIRSDIIFVYQGNEFVFDTFCGESSEFVSMMPDVAKAPITVNVYLKNGSYSITAEYRREMYNEAFISNLLDVFCLVLKGFTEKEKTGDIRLLSEAANARLQELNSTDRPFENISINRFIERYAEICPDRAAVICEGRSLTYRELNAAANRMANKLIACGVGKETIVGMMLPRSEYLAITELAILKAGGAFLGLLPDYPDERVDYCLQDAKVPVVITTQEITASRMGLFGEDKPYRALTVAELLESGSEEDPGLDIAPHDLAYCIYTSGSTGNPKGVLIEQHNLANIAQTADSAYSYFHGSKEVQTSLAVSSVSFDASVMDILLFLMNGKTVCLATEREVHNPAALARLISENHVDGILMTPSMIMNLLGIPEFRSVIRGLKTALIGAEAFPASLYSSLKELSPELNVLNGYGPSECTITCCAKRLEDERNITIGAPAPNTRFFIVDSLGNLLPPYALGELIICGEPVGRGYMNLPEKTKAAFFTMQGLPAYHSGDIVRLNADGEAEFFGRRDNQVKLRGFRVELDEIEKCICAFDGVTQSKVIVRSNGSEDYLVGFYTANGPIDQERLNAHMKAHLTYYMVPDAMMQLDVMPLTASGKIDKKALPEVKKERTKKVRKVAKKSLEQELCELFASVLSLNEFYADDNFFEMGGTSLSASKVVMQLMARGLNVEYQDIFDNPTPEMLAGHIEGLRQTAEEKKSAPGSAEILSDYSEQLQYNALPYAADVRREPLGDVLLTGAVGFLGIHVLKELIDRNEGNIICLVRSGKFSSGLERLKSMLVYYFDDTFEDVIARRFRVIEADITDNVTEALNGIHIDTIINCAACVKHYAADDILERINVQGVENLIEVATERNARMIQISTVSIPGAHTDETWKRGLKMYENNLFVADDMGNKYVISKYHAERRMLEAIKNGMRGKIIRVGNLMGRHRDGEFQINFNTNAFLNALRGFAVIGKAPVSHATDPMSLSPIDMTAKAVVLLSGTNDQFTAFHADNRFGFDEWQLIEAANLCGVKIAMVPEEEYYADYHRMLGDPRVNMKLRGLMTNDRPDINLVETDNKFTANILYRLGFSWPLPDLAYLERVIKGLLTLGYFDTENEES